MSTAISLAAFSFLAELLRSRSGLVIGQDKIYLLETRLAPILKREKLRDLNDLAERLHGRGADAVARDVVEAMTTNESFFFRDDKPFQHFRSQALGRLVAARPAGTPLRIWSAAASSGQEAYSLAMILAESRAVLGDRRVEVLGTDLARDQLSRAREGLYTQFEVQRGLPVQMLMRYFHREDAGWRISDALRAMVQWKDRGADGHRRHAVSRWCGDGVGPDHPVRTAAVGAGGLWAGVGHGAGPGAGVV
jgi:chemotaxis protein methyltransferase CheR